MGLERKSIRMRNSEPAGLGLRAWAPLGYLSILAHELTLKGQGHFFFLPHEVLAAPFAFLAPFPF